MKRGVVLLTAWKIARTYWFSEEKWSAWRLLLLVISLNLGLVCISVQLNAWQGVFYQVIQAYNYDGFRDAVINFAILLGVFVIVRGYQIYTRMLLHINWRRWLTDRYLADWLYQKTYYRFQLLSGHAADNPDQRISEDIEMFVSLTLRLSLDLLQDLVTVSSFVVILWNLSGVVHVAVGPVKLDVYGYLVWIALVYAGLGTYWTVKAGRPLVRLEYDQQRYEADFRYSLVRVRDNAESIALYAGEKQEKNNCLQHFQSIIGNFKSIILIRRKLMWLTTGYSEIAAVFAILIASPRYFSGQIHLGQMFQIIDAYHHVQVGFSFIIDSFTRLAQWRAVVNRLNNFLLVMETVRLEQPDYKVGISRGKKEEFCVDNLNVFRPDGFNLIRNLDMRLRRGERLIVTGLSGCGKSTLLRAFAGLWPYTRGHINIPEGRVMFVPQRSYMPIDTLRNVLLYPGTPRKIGDDELKEALTACRVSRLAGMLEQFSDWGQALSLGEQQRIAFARMLLLEPDWLFLDEATSALDEDTERIVYRYITDALKNTTIVSVGHRSTLVAYHRKRLNLDGRGGWHFENRTNECGIISSIK